MTRISKYVFFSYYSVHLFSIAWLFSIIQNSEQACRFHFDALESHMDALRDLKRELSYQLDDQKRRSQYQMEKTEQEFQNALDQKQTEIDMIETAFETYKQNIAAEVADKMFKLETKLKQEALDDKTNALKEQKERMELEHVNEIEKLHAKYQMEFKLMFQEKEREKDELLKNFTEATQDLAKFRSALEELDSLKSQYDNAKLEIRALQKETKNKSAEIRLVFH